MKTRTLLPLLGLLLLDSTARAAEPPAPSATKAAEAAATKAAEAWLALVDAGSYAESWSAAAAFFKGAITSEQWSAAVKGVRAPLGKVGSRKLTSATRTSSLPGAPDGDYVVLQFRTSFEHKKDAVETVTPMLDKDGQWRVSGYFIK